MLKDFLPRFDVPSDPATVQKPSLKPGYHLVHFSPSLPESALLPDGTDTLHSPGEPYNHRLWAGGKIRFDRHPIRRPVVQRLVCVEHIHDVRVRGHDESEKVFVTIRRYICRHVDGEAPAVATRKILKQAQALRPSFDVPVIEDRVLCFLRPDADGSMSSVAQVPKINPPPQDPYYTHTLVPSTALLFRFSALTFNAHAIHLDPEYTRKVYGLPNLVVHGPLTLILMLEVLRRAMQRYARMTKSPEVIVSEIDYTNLTPIYVNEAMTIACSPLGDRAATADKTGPQKWSIWIQKAVGAESTLAVRATVTTFDAQARGSTVPDGSKSEDAI